MSKLALTPKEIIDLKGVEARLANEIASGIPADVDVSEIEDLGLIEYEGRRYYGTVYRSKRLSDEDNE